VNSKARLSHSAAAFGITTGFLVAISPKADLFLTDWEEITVIGDKVFPQDFANLAPKFPCVARM
jgi:hypothetical protein